MLAFFIVITVLEVAVFLAVLVLYLLRIIRSLRGTAEDLGKVAFGVRAIETQVSTVGPSVTTINRQLSAIAAALAELEGAAESRA